MNDFYRDWLDGVERGVPSEELLALPASAEGARERILAGTERWLARRRARRPWVSAGRLAALYALGFTSAWFARSGTPAQASRAETPHAAEQTAALAPQALAAAGSDPAQELPRVERPEWLERVARQGALARRPERLRRAGDLYLEQHSDLEGALRCYSDYVSLLPRSERLSMQPDDSWLLAALKHDRN